MYFKSDLILYYTCIIVYGDMLYCTMLLYVELFITLHYIVDFYRGLSKNRKDHGKPQATTN